MPSIQDRYIEELKAIHIKSIQLKFNYFSYQYIPVRASTFFAIVLMRMKPVRRGRTLIIVDLITRAVKCLGKMSLSSANRQIWPELTRQRKRRQRNMLSE